MIQAHGFGGQSDLPISLSLAISGAVAALVVSFTVLVVAWRTPRFAGARSRPAPVWLDAAVRSSYLRRGVAALGMVLFLYTAMVAVLGEDQLTNPFFGIVYVWWWVGLVFASLLLGPVWRALNPMRTVTGLLARLGGTEPEAGIREYPAWLGHWPAALGLYAFVWMELVYPHSDELAPLRLWCAAYVAAMLVGGAVFGSRFFEYADPFEVYSTLVGRLSPWAVEAGRLVVRNPLANLSTTPARPGLVAVVAVLFGSTAFDSFSGSNFWIRTVQESTIIQSVLDNVALLVFCVTAGLVFATGCVLTGVASGTRRRDLPRQLAHSIVPIVAGYIVAHYLSYLVQSGTLTLANASDPFGRGWNLLGTANLPTVSWLAYHATFLATVKVLAVVVGHVAAAVSAHDRALEVLPSRHQVTGQLPLLLAMVAFTAGGLFLLFNG